MTLKRSMAIAIPACAIALGATAVACGSDDDTDTTLPTADSGVDAGPDAITQVISLAVVGFDANMDTTDANDDDATSVVISLAVQGFDAAVDASGDASDAGDAADH